LLRQENLSTNEQLRHARAQIAALISEKEQLILEYGEMDKKFQRVKELLQVYFKRFHYF
uniref:Transposase n=1 Tax=Enterobius vermicularis TaxID=51028 RepID=A0A0N4V560_ENTVE